MVVRGVQVVPPSVVLKKPSRPPVMTFARLTYSVVGRAGARASTIRLAFVTVMVVEPLLLAGIHVWHASIDVNAPAVLAGQSPPRAPYGMLPLVGSNTTAVPWTRVPERTRVQVMPPSVER